MKRNVLSMVKTYSLILLVLIVVGYGLFQAKKLLSGPVISIDTPQNGASYNQMLIEVTGTAKNIAYLYLDGRQIYTDTSGRFSEKLLLAPGYTIITVKGTDKFGSSAEKRAEVVLAE